MAANTSRFSAEKSVSNRSRRLGNHLPPRFEAQLKAAELERQLASLTGHELAKVRPYGKHLLIQMYRGDAVDTIARLTAIGRNVAHAVAPELAAARRHASVSSSHGERT